MIFKNVFEDLNISRNDFFYLLFLTVFSIILTYGLIVFNVDLGIYCSDVFIYLSNSLSLAGYPSSRVYLYLSPFICFLTSLLFRLGFVSEVSLYVVVGFFSILGNVGIYIFLRNKFSSLLSLCGAILFGSFSLNLVWWANGTLDVPAVALSVWTILFIILAIDKDSKYFLIAGPLLVVAIFTRYTALFLLPLILLYYLSFHDFFSNLELLFLNGHEFAKKVKCYIKSDEFRNILIACVLAIVLMGLVTYCIMAFGSSLSFLTQSSTFASGSKGEIIDNAYTDDTFFYIHDFPNFLFAGSVTIEKMVPILHEPNLVSYLLISLFVLGVILATYKLFKAYRKKEIKSTDKFDGLDASLGRKFLGMDFRYVIWISFILLLLIAILSFKVNSLITITILLVDFVILFSFLMKNGIDREKYSLNVLMLAWFLIYFIFFTFLNIKVNRYIITVFPAFIYFVIFALDNILDLSKKYEFFEFRGKNILNLIPIIIIVFCIFSALAFPSCVHCDDNFHKDQVIADYLIEYDPDYSSKDIAVYNQRSLNWFLKTKNIALTDEQLDYLDSHNVTYYISDDDFSLKNFRIIYQKDGLYLYERIG